MVLFLIIFLVGKFYIMTSDNKKNETIKIPYSLFKKIEINFEQSGQIIICYYFFGICFYKKAKIIQ